MKHPLHLSACNVYWLNQSQLRKLERSWANDYPDSFQLERQPALQLKEFKFNYLLVLFLFVRFPISRTVLKEICQNNDVTRRCFRYGIVLFIWATELPELHVHTHLPKTSAMILSYVSSTRDVQTTNISHKSAYHLLTKCHLSVKRCFT